MEPDLTILVQWVAAPLEVESALACDRATTMAVSRCRSPSMITYPPDHTTITINPSDLTQ